MANSNQLNQSSIMNFNQIIPPRTSSYETLTSLVPLQSASTSSNYQLQQPSAEPLNWMPNNYSNDQSYYFNNHGYYPPVQVMQYPQVVQISHMQNQIYYNSQPQQELEQEIIHTDQVWSVHQAPLPASLPQLSTASSSMHDKADDSEVDLVDPGFCKPFISKLGYLLRNSELYGDVIQWDRTGTMFIFAASKRFTDEVLPQIFSHSSTAAFTRQLNTYAFRHLSAVQLSDSFSHSPDTFTPIKDLSAWYHQLFSRDSPLDANRLTPTPSRARAAFRKAKHEMLSERGIGKASFPTSIKVPKVLKEPQSTKMVKNKKASV